MQRLSKISDTIPVIAMNGRNIHDHSIQPVMKYLKFNFLQRCLTLIINNIDFDRSIGLFTTFIIQWFTYTTARLTNYNAV